MIKISNILKEIAQNKTAVLIDGTSSAGKSVVAKLLGAIPYYEASNPDQWVQIDSDMFSGFDNDEEERRLKLDHPNVRKWAKGNEYGMTTILFRKDGKEAPENPYEKTNPYKGGDIRAWYMAQEYKTGPWKKVIFDSIDDSILKYVPNVKHVLLHAPLPVLFNNIAGRPAGDTRDPKMVLKQYLEKYTALTSKPSPDKGDPDNILTKSELKDMLSKSIKDEKWIDNFIAELGIKGEGNYYIHAKNIDPDKTILINVDADQKKYVQDLKNIVS
jgi:hypothetical protein